MKAYKKPEKTLWQGRISDAQDYLHEKVIFVDLERDALEIAKPKSFGLLGYACEAGVQRNQGRIGTAQAPAAIRKALAKLPNPLRASTVLLDVGTVVCERAEMESAQNDLADNVNLLLDRQIIPIILGGGHDMAYGHFKGIRGFLDSQKQTASLGIINFDAHFDLRRLDTEGNSGTPFFQIASDCAAAQDTFHYLCLGIRDDANSKPLFKTAAALGTQYIKNDTFHMGNWPTIQKAIRQFAAQVDQLYITLDLDGFSSAYAPGVSAASPMGFSPDIVCMALEEIINTNKVISMDIAEMNPRYDSDGQTAKLAASLLHFILRKTDLC